MIAAAGMTETAAAAAIGSMPQPSTSIRTSRKSAAVSAAETSASARFGASRSRVVDGRGTTGTRHAEITGARTASAIGTWTANTARHDSACVSTPPIAGPTAAPIAAAPTHILTPRSCDLATAGRSSSAAQTTAAPLTAWTQRAAITVSRLPATAAAAEAAAKTTRPAASIRTGPNRRADDRRGHGRQRHREVERRDDPRDAGDRRVERRQHVGQREHDDRRVGQHHPDRHGEADLRPHRAARLDHNCRDDLNRHGRTPALPPAGGSLASPPPRRTARRAPGRGAAGRRMSRSGCLKPWRMRTPRTRAHG